MQRNLGIIVLSCVTIGLVVLFVLLSRANDTVGPEISFDEGQELVYDMAGDTSVLLNGVTAWDKEDGDVSSSLMIQDVNYNADNSGVVTYVARDSSNNVTTVKRKFICQPQLPPQEGIPEGGMEGEPLPEGGEGVPEGYLGGVVPPDQFSEEGNTPEGQ